MLKFVSFAARQESLPFFLPVRHKVIDVFLKDTKHASAELKQQREPQPSCGAAGSHSPFSPQKPQLPRKGLWRASGATHKNFVPNHIFQLQLPGDLLQGHFIICLQKPWKKRVFHQELAVHPHWKLNQQLLPFPALQSSAFFKIRQDRSSLYLVSYFILSLRAQKFLPYKEIQREAGLNCWKRNFIQYIQTTELNIAEHGISDVLLAIQMDFQEVLSYLFHFPVVF